MFGTNNIIKEPNGLIIENYIKSETKLNKHVKCFVRPREIKYVNNPHYYNIKNINKMYNIDGKKMKLFSYYAFHENNLLHQNVSAYIAHYFYQSEETYVKRKIQLPQDDTGNMRGKKDPNIHFHYNDIINEYPKNKYLENIKLFLKRYE
jgi:hypothetical protein